MDLVSRMLKRPERCSRRDWLCGPDSQVYGSVMGEPESRRHVVESDEYLLMGV
jgi:hypothetical protein